MSPFSGGLQITWSELMSMTVKDRDIIAERVKELRDREFELAKQMYQVREK
jgi:hypothetical protein